MLQWRCSCAATFDRAAAEPPRCSLRAPTASATTRTQHASAAGAVAGAVPHVCARLPGARAAGGSGGGAGADGRPPPALLGRSCGGVVAACAGRSPRAATGKGGWVSGWVACSGGPPSVAYPPAPAPPTPACAGAARPGVHPVSRGGAAVAHSFRAAPAPPVCPPLPRFVRPAHALPAGGCRRAVHALVSRTLSVCCRVGARRPRSSLHAGGRLAWAGAARRPCKACTCM